MLQIPKDSWWQTDYATYSIRNYESIPLFQKYFAISSPYKFTFSGVHEEYSSTEAYQSLEQSTTDHKLSEKVGYDNLKSAYFYQRVLQEPECKLQIYSEITSEAESGEIIKTYAKHEDKLIWRLSKDSKNLQEFPDADPETFTKYYLNSTGKKKTEKDLVSYSITTFTSFFQFMKEEKLSRGTKSSIEKIDGNKYRIKSIKTSTNLKYKKVTVKVITADKETVTITRERNNEKVEEQIIIKKTGKCSVVQSNRKERGEFKSGRYLHKTEAGQYLIEWRMMKNQFLCCVNGFKGDRRWMKRVKRLDTVMIEEDEFEINGHRWGMVRDNSKASKTTVKWTGSIPEFCKNYSGLDHFSENESEIIDGEYFLAQSISDADFIFKSLQFVQINNFTLYSLEKDKEFSSLSLPHHMSSYESQLLTWKGALNQLFNKLENRSCPDSVSSLTSKNCNSSDSMSLDDLINAPDDNTDLAETLYQETYLKRILKSLMASKKAIFKLMMPAGLIYEFLETRSELLKILQSRRKIADRINLEESSRESREWEDFRIDSSVIRCVESDSNNMICVNCSESCHEECKIDSERENLGGKPIKECSGFGLGNKNCGKCLRNCSYKDHVYSGKQIAWLNDPDIECKNVEELKGQLDVFDIKLAEILKRIRASRHTDIFFKEFQRLVFVTAEALSIHSNLENEILSTELSLFQEVISLFLS